MGLRIAIIGAGVMLKYQAEGFRLTDAKIICIADINPTVARNAATTYNIPRVFESAKEMLVQM